MLKKLERETLDEIFRKPRTIPIPRWITPRHYTTTLAECFGHASFILVAVSYAVDDFLMLRIIAVAGSTAILFFTYFHPHGRVLWLPLKWNVLFIMLNSYRIGRVCVEQYFSGQLPREILEIRNKSYYLMNPRDFAKLARLGTIKDYNPGDEVVKQHELNSNVFLILSGEMGVYHNEGLTYTLEKSNFVAENGLHVGLHLTGNIESCCTVAAETPVRVLVWDRTELANLMRRNSGVRRSLQAALSWDIVRKLKQQRHLLASGRITEDTEVWNERRNSQTEMRYHSLLLNILSSPYCSELRKELNKYRMIHHIDDHAHEKTLKDCGWTLSEFEAGHKEGIGILDDSVVYSWRARAQDALYRFVGVR
jgi:CRP-like cAMP-binding protein